MDTAKTTDSAVTETYEESVKRKTAKALAYMKLDKYEKQGSKYFRFFHDFPTKFVSFFKKLGFSVARFFIKIGEFFRDLVMTFVHGDWKTKVSYAIMGFGSFARGQIGRGVLFIAMEVVFIWFMIVTGVPYLRQMGTLGTQGAVEEWNDELQTFTTTYHDNSFRILLYSVMTLFFIVAFLYTWYLNIKQNRINEELIREDKKIKSTGDDLRSLVDEDFHKTLLALPVLGITVFTILPIFFMILVAFTNYDGQHQPPQNLFTWVGFSNFNTLLNWGNGTGKQFLTTFGELVTWTLIWAFFATFTNYFLGMLIAMLINKKGIRLKKLWRTILVVTIAVPQFVSLLYVSKMFDTDGIVNGLLIKWGWISNPIPFWTNRYWARFMVILINIWIGIPYLMLIVTGILMNIPQDLYESAKIDGANAWQTYTKITLPYMLFVTGPYLLTSFTSNMNNFNVIFLLSGGKPADVTLYGGSGYTDLLITWLYKVTLDKSSYNVAAVIGILVFVVVALISTITFNLLPSNRHEEDFQ